MERNTYIVVNISPDAHRKPGIVQTWAVVNRYDDSEMGVQATCTTREEARRIAARYNSPAMGAGRMA